MLSGVEEAKVQDAETHLSALLARVEPGEQIVIARGRQPVARLVPIDGQDRRDLGFVSYSVPDTLFDPLTDDELAGWEG